jgi:hypothetical protein
MKSTIGEKAFLVTMLDHTGPEAQVFLPQLEWLVVKSGCSCGCPSLDFAPLPVSARVDAPYTNIVAHMNGESSDGLAGVILWQAGGRLTGLEVYDLAGRDDTTPYELPRIETLAKF